MKKFVAAALVAVLAVAGLAGTAIAKGKTGNPVDPGHSKNPNPGK